MSEHIQVGDINSTAVGSGARFNAGKPDISLIPFTFLAEFLLQEDAEDRIEAPSDIAVFAQIAALQLVIKDANTADGANFAHSLLAGALLDLYCGDAELALKDVANVFTYGTKKYAAWNWLKGMKWSVPVACIGRHLIKIAIGEELDQESGLPHRGHIGCNIVMLHTYISTFPQGNDLPAKVLDRSCLES